MCDFYGYWYIECLYILLVISIWVFLSKGIVLSIWIFLIIWIVLSIILV